MNNVFQNLMTMLNGRNPMQILQGAMMNNVKNNQMYNQLQNSIKSSGLSSKDYAMQLFKQRGMSEEQIMQLAQRFGAK